MFLRKYCDTACLASQRFVLNRIDLCALKICENVFKNKCIRVFFHFIFGPRVSSSRAAHLSHTAVMVVVVDSTRASRTMDGRPASTLVQLLLFFKMQVDQKSCLFCVEVQCGCICSFRVALNKIRNKPKRNMKCLYLFNPLKWSLKRER